MSPESTQSKRVLVTKLLSSRYESGQRPASWDERVDGIDRVQTSEGEELELYSDGQQSPPQPGWTLLLRGEAGGDAGSALKWTLYGMNDEASEHIAGDKESQAAA